MIVLTLLAVIIFVSRLPLSPTVEKQNCKILSRAKNMILFGESEVPHIMFQFLQIPGYGRQSSNYGPRDF